MRETIKEKRKKFLNQIGKGFFWDRKSGFPVQGTRFCECFLLQSIEQVTGEKKAISVKKE